MGRKGRTRTAWCGRLERGPTTPVFGARPGRRGRRSGRPGQEVLSTGTWDRGHLASELGDAIYHWARLCTMAGCVPSELLERSVTTIEARIPGQVSGASRIDEIGN